MRRGILSKIILTAVIREGHTVTTTAVFTGRFSSDYSRFL